MRIPGTRGPVTIRPGPEGMIDVWARPPHGVLYPEHEPVREALCQSEAIGGRPHRGPVGKTGPDPRSGHGPIKDWTSRRVGPAQRQRKTGGRVAIDERKSPEIDGRTGRLRTEVRLDLRSGGVRRVLGLSATFRPSPPQNDQKEKRPTGNAPHHHQPMLIPRQSPLSRPPPPRRHSTRAQSPGGWPT